MKRILLKPLLLLLAVIVILIMIRLGIWQLGRADEKQAILDQQNSLAMSSPQALGDMDHNKLQRFTAVTVEGTYIESQTVLLDNQVLDSKVGYLAFTPMQISGTSWSVLVNRGWLPVGSTRSELPLISTRSEPHQIIGRLNTPPPQPPLWNEALAVNQGSVWQYLPIDQVAQQMDLKLLPLVVELAPEFAGELEPALTRRWRAIDNKWVATHHGYAFQWFAMALAFFIACVVLTLRSASNQPSDIDN